MVKVRLFRWWCCVCCIVLLTLWFLLAFFFLNEPAMTTIKLPLVGWLKFFLNRIELNWIKLNWIETWERGYMVCESATITIFWLVLILKDGRSAEFLAFIRLVVTRQWSFSPILWPWHTRFSLLLIPEIQLCARPATQLTRSPYFRQIVHASPLHMREDLSERGALYWRLAIRLYKVTEVIVQHAEFHV